MKRKLIIHSGTSKHVVAKINLFHTVADVEEVEVQLLNDYMLKSRHKDKMLADTKFIILVMSTVYYIPTL